MLGGGMAERCEKCFVVAPSREYRTHAAGDEQDRRNAAARRRLEDLRVEVELGIR